MGKENFFTKLHREEKLLIINPGEELKEAYMRKSESNLASAKILLDSDKLEECVSLTYYSMFNIVLALFFKTGIKCENHSAAIILLEKIFGVNNDEISRAKRERIDKQYYVDFSITKEEVRNLIRKAEGFNAKILDFIEKLNNEKIKIFRNEIEKLLEGE